MVLNEAGKALPDVVAGIKAHCAQRLAAFKVPANIFVTDVLVSGMGGVGG